MMLLAGIKGTFNGEEGHRQKSSVQSIIYRITGYYRLSVSDILLSNLTFGILLSCQIGILRNERYISLFMLRNIAYCRFECVKSHTNIGLFTVY